MQHPTVSRELIAGDGIGGLATAIAHFAAHFISKILSME
jgi:hypothetical protein